MDANKRNTENKEKMRGLEEEGERKEGRRGKGRTRGGNFYSHVAGIVMSVCS